MEKDLIKGAGVFKGFADFFCFFGRRAVRQNNVHSITAVRPNDMLTCGSAADFCVMFPCTAAAGNFCAVRDAHLIEHTADNRQSFPEFRFQLLDLFVDVGSLRRQVVRLNFAAAVAG